MRCRINLQNMNLEHFVLELGFLQLTHIFELTSLI